MECKNCGKEIPDGFEYCQECEEKLQEEKVFTISKTDIKKAQDKKRLEHLGDNVERTGKPIPREGVAIDLEGYGKALVKDLTTTLAFIGAIMIYLAPFMKWAWIEGGGQNRSATLFELAEKNKAVTGVISTTYNLNKKVFLFIAIGILACAIVQLILSACDYVPVLRFLGDLTWVRLVSLALIVLLLALVMVNKSYVNLLDAIEASVSGSGGSIDGGHGAGPFVLISGFIFNLIANVAEIKARK